MIEDDRLFDLAGLNANALYAQAEELRAIAGELLTARHALGRVETLIHTFESTSEDSVVRRAAMSLAKALREAIHPKEQHDKDQY